MSDEVWQTAVVTATSEVASQIRRIEFRTELPTRLVPGAHVDVLLEIQGRVERRSYSVLEGLGDDDRGVVLSVALSPTSRGGSSWMHRLAVGDRVRMSRPTSSFPLGQRARHYLLIAGGIGITALASMAERLRARGADYRMLYLGRDRESLAYPELLEQRHGDRIQVHLSAERGRMDLGAVIDALDDGTECYVCGPLSMMNAVQSAWVRRGLSPALLRFETFANSGAVEPEAFVVRVPRLGATVTVGADESMLDALERAGVPMMYECRKGECGLCTVHVRERRGEIDHRDVFLSERQRALCDRMCACVSRGYATDGRPAELAIETT